MNKPIRILLNHILFFFLLFFIGRTFFLFYNFTEIRMEKMPSILNTFLQGLYIDSSMVSYLLFLLLIPYLIFIFFQKHWAFSVLKFLSSVFIILYVIIIVSELMLYKEWKTKLSFRAVAFMSNVSEVMDVISLTQLSGGLFVIVALSFIFIYIQNRFFLNVQTPFFIHPKKYKWLSVFLLLVLIPIGIRGGFQPIPMTQSDVYFSKNNTLNLAAVNSVWNFGQSLIENRYNGSNNPYLFYDSITAKKLIHGLLQNPKDSIPKVLNQKRPNIVLIMLESWSADLIGTFNGPDSVAPNLSKLSRSGIRFINCISPGTLSDEGHVSILSGFPALPLTILTHQPQKYHGLQSLTKYLMDSAYSTCYMYNGDLAYGNIKSYVFYNGFQNVYDKNNIEEKGWKSGRLGYNDAYLFDRMKPKLNQLKSPFFLTAFTLSTHSPFDFEGQRKITDKGEYNDYLNSAAYSDSVIGSFMTYAKTQSWYANTLFVFLSDHSHPTPTNNTHYFPEDRRMVAFLYGDVVAKDWKGKCINHVVSQHDFAPSLCELLQIPHQFKFGKHIFNPKINHFAYYSYDVGFGFVTDSASYVYDLRSNNVNISTFKSKKGEARADSLGRAYLQSLYTDYLSF